MKIERIESVRRSAQERTRTLSGAPGRSGIVSVTTICSKFAEARFSYVPALKTGAIESPSPFTPLGSKGMGEGGGGGIHCVCSAIQDALRPAGRPIVYDSCNPYHRVWSMLQDPESTRANVSVVPA